MSMSLVIILTFDCSAAARYFSSCIKIIKNGLFSIQHIVHKTMFCFFAYDVLKRERAEDRAVISTMTVGWFNTNVFLH